MIDIQANIRTELVRLCGKSKCRTAVWTRDRPTSWSPTVVKDPRSPDGDHFTDLSAWDYIIEILQANAFVETILLDQPKGKFGYVIQITPLGHPKIYIKLQMAPPGVIGRSFHYSEHQ